MHLFNKYKYLDLVLVLTGIFLFALCIHQDFPLIAIAFLGLILIVFASNHSLSDRSFLHSITGRGYQKDKILFFVGISIILGIGLGAWYRESFENTLFPDRLTWFALVAPLIGITEELVFRGYIQGRSRSLGIFPSLILATGAHTLYKFVVLKSMPDPLHIDFLLLTGLTFVVGLIFGYIRELSGSVAPPAIAHGVFDIMLYGAMASAPVWVWG